MDRYSRPQSARKLRAGSFNFGAEGAIRFVTRLRNSIVHDGWIPTLARVVRYPVNRLRNRWYYRMLGNGSAAEIFAAIYDKNLWSDEESVSGPGSTLEATVDVQRDLPILFEKFAIRSIFDAPCGDFHWMQHVIRAGGIEYFGADIVQSLIQKNIEIRQTDRTRFSVMNICTDSFPPADLWLCRDCLIHLCYRDILSALEKFCSSSIPFILTTTTVESSTIKNCDIPTGQYREINLFAEPFRFPRDVLFRIDDPGAEGELCLWSRRQIESALPALRRSLGA